MNIYTSYIVIDEHTINPITWVSAIVRTVPASDEPPADRDQRLDDPGPPRRNLAIGSDTGD